MLIRGRIWKFGDNIDTDLMMPHGAFKESLREQVRSIFKVNRPGWVDQVKQGDMIVAGRNFGTGSSRPAARLFKSLGIEAIIADSVNGLFFRNCINYGLFAFNCLSVSEHFQEGEVAEIDPRAGTIKNMTTGVSLKTEVLPEMLMKIISAGGIIELLKREGYLAPLEREKEKGK